MAFGSLGNQGAGSAPMSEINVIPLVDIMLVLLVIFIITAPLVTNSVEINLPKVASQPTQQEPASVKVAIDAVGQLYWNGEPIDRATLNRHLIAAGQRSPTPSLHLRAADGTRYGLVVDIMAQAGKAGLEKIAFVSDPSGTSDTDE